MSTAFLPDMVVHNKMHTKSRNAAGKVLHLKRSATHDKEELKAILRMWLESVRDSSGLSFEKIAHEAGVDPSTLTRFMKPAYRFALGLETVRRISNRFKIAPPKELGIDFIPPGFAEPELRTWEPPHAFDPHSIERNSVDWWEVRSYLLDLEGFIPGDKIAVDLNRQAMPGDIVVAQMEVSGGRDVQTVLRKYEPPLVTCHTTARDYPRPEFVDGHRIIIMGVVTRLHRDMVSAAAE